MEPRNIKIALLGAGKTGSKILEVANKHHEITIFNSSNRPTLENLMNHDIIISFLPGGVFKEYIPLLLEVGLPLVSGTTGIELDDDIDTQLKSRGLTWITASNFAIGMNLVKQIINTLSRGADLFPDSEYQIYEKHHINKKDAPSGTAKTWAKWLGKPVTFSHDREGDVIGIHQLTFSSEFETIVVKHEVKDRKVFARGALWTVDWMLKNKPRPGLHELSELMEEIL